MARVALAFLLAFLGCVAAGNDFNPPKWYHGHDGPIFSVLKTDGDIEQRHYGAEKWTAVNISGASFDDAWSQGTDKLDKLWKGESQEKARIDTTVPKYALLYPTGQGRTLQSTFTIQYFLPHELHGSPPTPLDQDLKVTDVQAYDVWVKVFSGFARESDVIDQGFSLIDDLKGKGLDVDDSVFAYASYDSPSHLVGRHNEVWVWEKQPPPSVATAFLAAARQRLAEVQARFAYQRAEPAAVVADE